MNKNDAMQLIRDSRAWFVEGAQDAAVYEAVFDAFELDEYNGDAFVAPVPFARLLTQPVLKGKSKKSLDSLIRRMQDKMDGDQFALRTSVYLKPVKGYCYMILGTEQVTVVRDKKTEGGLENIALSFKDASEDDRLLPSFKDGDPVKFSVSSPIKGWLYLFAVDSNRMISPIYPGEGEKSEIGVSENSRLDDVCEKINKRIDDASTLVKPEPLKFCGTTEGYERIVAMVVGSENPIPVTIAHLRSRFPLPFLFAHLQRHRGVGYAQVADGNDFLSRPLSKIAIGTLDYYYKG